MRRPGIAGLALVLVAAGLVTGAPIAPASSQDSCAGTGTPASLPPGEHAIPLSSTLSGDGRVGPIGTFSISMAYDGEVRLVVGDDGAVRDASATLTLGIAGAITGIPGVGGDLTGTGSGTLALLAASGEEIRLGGTVDGVGQLDFSGVFDQTWGGADGAPETLTLRVASSGCDQVSGDATSALLEATATQLASTGLTVAQTQMSWQAGATASPEVQEIRADLAAIEELGTAGPERRAATSRLAKALGRIKALPDEQQACLFRAWQATARAVLQKRIDRDIAVVDALQPTSADLGPLHGAVASLLESEKQYHLLGFDACSEGDRRPAFQSIAAAMRRFLERAIEDGRIVDAVRLLKDLHFFGDVSPALAEEADAAIGDALEDLMRTTLTNLERLAREADAAGDGECSLTDRHTVRKAVTAAKHLDLWGGESPPLDTILGHAEVLGCVA